MSIDLGKVKAQCALYVNNKNIYTFVNGLIVKNTVLYCFYSWL